MAMMTKTSLKGHIVETVDSGKQDILDVAADIFGHPELGYKEVRTAKIVEKALARLGLKVSTGLALTGVAAKLETGRPGPNVCVMGELDAVVCPGHPLADPLTGAAHACGHMGQVASMLGVASALVTSKAKDYLSGSVTFLGVPAEEFVEIEYREKLRREGAIQFLGGKQELLAKGFFDDVDICMMVHMATLSNGKKVVVGGTSNGFVGKLARYKGKEAHAGGAPHLGVNALNAATLGLMAIHAVRETFKDGDHIRVHPIITKGGDLVNVVPADVRMETYVRGKTVEAMIDANAKVTRALEAGAYAIGADVEIVDLPGYLPQIGCPSLEEVFSANAKDLLGNEAVAKGDHGTGSSDMGDLMHVMPAIQPSCGGASGGFHSESFTVDDPETAYIVPAKLMALTVVDLLWDDGGLAAEIVREHRPAMAKGDYLAWWDTVLAKTP